METDKATKVDPFPDSVHTSSAGGLLMGHAILVGLKAPAVVSLVDIDAKAKKATTQACKVDKLEANEKGVCFERLDAALPMPIAQGWDSLLPYVNNLKDLNEYGLKVTGLADGKYDLTIDDKKVGT